jgi:hypothetical protein
MATLGTYQRFNIIGSGPGSEVWQTGFWTAAITPPSTQAALQTDCDAIAAFVTTWWNAVKVDIAQGYALQKLNAYQYVAPSTSATLQASHQYTASPGTGGSSGNPLDTALVVSIRSAVPGRSHRGRMYIPFHNPINGSTGCCVASEYATYGTATKALFTSVAGYSSYVPVVVSRTHNTWDPVANIDTDNLPDVQRRRVNRLHPTATQVLAFP